MRRLSPEAFTEAFTGHGRALWCVARAVLGRADQVEDVLQEGAIIALRKLDQFDADTSFLAWMSRIVRFVALNHGRRRQRQRATALEPGALDQLARTGADRVPSPMTMWGDVSVDQTEFDDELAQALGALEATPRACLLLRTIENMPYREIALALDIPEGTAMSHVHRARHLLRTRLTAARLPAPDGSRSS